MPSVLRLGHRLLATRSSRNKGTWQVVGVRQKTQNERTLCPKTLEHRLNIASKRGPKLMSGVPSWSSGGVLGGPWELFGSRTPPKRIKGLYRSLLGSSWAPSRGQVGGQKATMGSPGRRLESIFDRLGCLLVRFFGIFKPNRASVWLFFFESLES